MGCVIEERSKTEMLAAGDWRATREATLPPAEVRTYHLPSLYSPLGWASWGEARARVRRGERGRGRGRRHAAQGVHQHAPG
jgi:hypothetical protein